MNFNTKRQAVWAASGVAVAMCVAVPVLANHSWGSYHWSTPDGVVTAPIRDHTTGTWPTRVAIARTDWNNSDHINSALTQDGSGESDCSIRVGEIHVCNDDYGDNGWLGIASISAYRGRYAHIAGGVTKLNDFYFDTYTYQGEKVYDTPAWRQLVACQEIGHDYGLGHQNENFGTDATDSCMEYTYDPTNNQHPDFHDYDQLIAIYSHDLPSDGGDGGTTDPGPGNGNKGGKKKLGTPGNSPAEWGQAIAFDAKGRPNVYKRSTASYDIITHVTWAPHMDIDHIHEETGPRRHTGERIFPGG